MSESTQPSAAGESEEMKNLAALAHGLVFLGYLVPFANVLAPLIIYLIKRDQSAFVSAHAKESLNFQITQLIATLVFAVLSVVGVGCVLLVAQVVFELVYVIRATLAARDGLPFTYPLTLRLV